MPDSDCCPYCRAPLSLKQIIDLMNGSGFVRHVRVRLADGSLTTMKAQEVNPRTVTVLEESAPIRRQP